MAGFMKRKSMPPPPKKTKSMPPPPKKTKSMPPPPKKTKSMPPPPKKAKDEKPQPNRPSRVLYPYDTTLALFRNSKPKDAEIEASPEISNISAPFSAIEQESPVSPDGLGIAVTSSATYPSFPTVQEDEVSSRYRPTLDHARTNTFLSLPASVKPTIGLARTNTFLSLPATVRPTLDHARPKTFLSMPVNIPDESISDYGPHTAPLPSMQDSETVSQSSNGTPVSNTPVSSYGFMSSTMDDNSPIEVPILMQTSSPDLEVYKRHQNNGRLIVCDAREQHCSFGVKNFLGERTGLRYIEELKEELLEMLGALSEGGKGRARRSLKVVTGNMLERIVAWDLNKAEVLEQSNIPLLSTVPTTENMNKVDAVYIIKMFRSGMRKIPRHDIRFKVGALPDEDLMALLHFTLLISRPTLVWELDLDEI